MGRTRTTVTTTETAPRLWSRDFVLVTVSAFFVLGSFFATFPLIPSYVEDELGGGKVAVGLAVGIFAVSAVAVRPIVGRLGDTRGRKFIIVGGIVIIVGGLALHALADTLAALLAIRFVMGVGEAMFFIGAATLVYDLAPPERRGQATNYFSVAIYGGTAVGPAVGEAVERAWGFDGAFLAAAAMGWIGLGMSLRLDRHVPSFQTAGERHQLTLRQRYFHPRAVPPGIILLLGTLTFAAFTGFVPLYAEDLGLPGVAPLFALYGTLVVLIRIVAAKLPDRLGTVPTASMAMIGIASGMAIMAAIPSVFGLYLGTVVWALGISLQYPTLLVAAIQGVPESERATATGTFTMFFEIAGGIGGPLLGIVAALSGDRATFVVSALSALTGVVLLRTWVAAKLETPASAMVAPTEG